jgi:2-hydroxy-3-keto-5-methylthiopentenyl-1-phosphate phosphatase
MLCPPSRYWIYQTMGLMAYMNNLLLMVLLQVKEINFISNVLKMIRVNPSFKAVQDFLKDEDLRLNL